MGNELQILRLTLNTGPQSESYNQFHSYRRGREGAERSFIYSFRGDPGSGASVIAFGGEPEPEGYAGASVQQFLRTVRRFLREDRDRAGSGTIVHIHHAAVGLLFHLARWSCLGRRRRILYNVHNVFSNYDAKYKVMTFLNILLANRVVCVSRASYRSMPAVLRRLKGERMTFIRNGVDLERLDRVRRGGTTAPAPSSDGLIRLITVGKFYRQKNYPFLLEVFRRLPEAFRLVAVGEGPDRPAVEALAGELGVAGRIEFTGLIPREQVFARMAEADIYVSASLWEGLPVGVLEAMASELPLILSAIGPHREIAEIAPSLALVDFEADAWAGAIQKMAEKSVEQRREIGQQNRAAVEENLTLSNMHRQYDKVYEALVRD